jgi:hypothetical protein
VSRPTTGAKTNVTIPSGSALAAGDSFVLFDASPAGFTGMPAKTDITVAGWDVAIGTAGAAQSILKIDLIGKAAPPTTTAATGVPTLGETALALLAGGAAMRMRRYQ